VAPVVEVALVVAQALVVSVAKAVALPLPQPPLLPAALVVEQLGSAAILDR
jgi:hypothetical protein